MAISILHNEKMLLRQTAEGQPNAFATLYDHYRPSLYSFVAGYLKSPPMAEDITQEIFLKVWEKKEQLTEVQSFSAYLFTIARNHTLNVLKRIAVNNEATGYIMRTVEEKRNTTEEQLLLEEYFKKVSEVLSSLPPQTREIFRLSREEEKSYEEIAALLGISRDAVKKHIVRSNKALRNALENDLDITPALLIYILLYSAN